MGGAERGEWERQVLVTVVWRTERNKDKGTFSCKLLHLRLIFMYSTRLVWWVFSFQAEKHFPSQQVGGMKSINFKTKHEMLWNELLNQQSVIVDVIHEDKTAQNLKYPVKQLALKRSKTGCMLSIRETPCDVLDGAWVRWDVSFSSNCEYSVKAWL